MKRSSSTQKRWYAVTYRGTAEMTVWVEAESATDAKAKDENVEYDEYRWRRDL